MKRILITGTNSYIGTSFEKWVTQWPDQFMIDTIDMKDESWRNVSFHGYDSIFHVAGIAHVDIKKASQETIDLYYKINRDLAIETAIKAKKNGVKQFVFMSSIIVYGNCKHKDMIINCFTEPKPNNFYGESKLEAEKGILLLQDESFHVVIIRPPMIFGKNSKGNYSRLSKLARIIPIFPDFKNERSMLYIDNLCEFIKLIILFEEKGLFYPQNNEYIQTSELVRMIADIHSHKILFVRIFNPFIRIMRNRLEIFSKIFGNLVYEHTMSNYSFDYNVVKNLEDAVRETEE